LLGCGAIVQRWQLPQYLEHGLRVEAVVDPDLDAVARVQQLAPRVRRHETLDALLDDDSVDLVDIATTVAGRADLIVRALNAGKHVLAQKPLCLTSDELERIRLAATDPNAPAFAVNFNGRWAPQWRAARHLIEAGAIGNILAVTHLHDFSMRWTRDVARHGSPHFLLFDYMIHWLDISQVWLGPRSRYEVSAKTIDHAAGDGQISQSGWLNFVADGTVDVSIRSVAAGVRYVGHPFIIHGSEGALRGAVDAPDSGDHLTLDRPGGRVRLDLKGNWFPDGFIGAMGDLLCAAEEGRKPDADFSGCNPSSAPATRRVAC
jgi:predicted dehydrogenase